MLNWIKSNWKDILIIIAICLVVVFIFSVVSESCKTKPITPAPQVPDTIGAYKIEQRLIGIDRKLDAFQRGQQEALESIYSDMAKEKQKYITKRKEHEAEPIDTAYKRVKGKLRKLQVKYE